MSAISLYDKFGRKHDYLRISVTDACNLRCTYCMPSGKTECFSATERMSLDEIDYIASTFVKLGIKKIRLTGGEPLVRKDIDQILYKLSKHPIELAITTNGVFIDKHIDAFLKSGIKSVNVSLDTLIPSKFKFITQKNLFTKVRSNILLLLNNNFNVKINIVVLKGINDSEINEFVELTRFYPLHIRFIEFMPFNGNSWNQEEVIDYKTIINTINGKYKTIKLIDEKHDTAKKFKVADYRGTFAVISTITESFCMDCNRLRLTSDGKMKNCLFSQEETDLLKLTRSGINLEEHIVNCVRKKEKEKGGQMLDKNMSNRSMVKIGG